MGALATLWQNIIAAQVLAFDPSKGYLLLEIDVCDKQVGWMPIQNQPVGAKFRYEIDSEVYQGRKNYDMTHRECPGVVKAIILLRPYLQGQIFKICSDHEALKLILILTDLRERLARWILRISELDFEVVLKVAKKPSYGRFIATWNRWNRQ